MELSGQNSDLGPFPHGPCPRTYELNPEKIEQRTVIKSSEGKFDGDVFTASTTGVLERSEDELGGFSDEKAQGYPVQVRSRRGDPTGSDLTGTTGEQSFISAPIGTYGAYR